MTSIVLIGPAAQWEQFRAALTAMIQGDEAASARGITLGDPAMEAAGVEGRRFAIAHPLDETAVAWITARLLPGYTLLSELPADWRHPEEFRA